MQRLSAEPRPHLSAELMMLVCFRCVFQRLLPFTQYQASVVRRGGVVGTLRNCCFDHSEETCACTKLPLRLHVERRDLSQTGASRTSELLPGPQRSRSALLSSPHVQIKAPTVTFCKTNSSSGFPLACMDDLHEGPSVIHYSTLRAQRFFCTKFCSFPHRRFTVKCVLLKELQ